MGRRGREIARAEFEEEEIIAELVGIYLYMMHRGPRPA
jgi:hypothetical protein